MSAELEERLEKLRVEMRTLLELRGALEGQLSAKMFLIRELEAKLGIAPTEFFQTNRFLYHARQS